ncbi:hypothetical protein DAPPUDRAFT_325730 [Daphnia pulex]|uniref:Uncharacterized protein n=1 Tax=Daphnia pulex TaxID=6669 RepID=E9H5D9_DAPPU|nr:hypothetical protein DAPPUDRAFT_325730 [Daphnia pulex]|eukprot:EFX72942.1 hypothetical protein DAPPUDRAFT_325730 [Daphnia pulex]
MYWLSSVLTSLHIQKTHGQCPLDTVSQDDKEPYGMNAMESTDMFLVKVNFQMPSQESKVSIDTGRYYSQPSRRKTLELSSIWPVNPISSPEE